MIGLFDLLVAHFIVSAFEKKEPEPDESDTYIMKEDDEISIDCYLSPNVQEQMEKCTDFFKVAGLSSLHQVTPYLLTYEDLTSYVKTFDLYIDGLAYESERKVEPCQE